MFTASLSQNRPLKNSTSTVMITAAIKTMQSMVPVFCNVAYSGWETAGQFSQIGAGAIRRSTVSAAPARTVSGELTIE